MEAIEGRNKPLVRVWDRYFNLVYSGEGDIGEVMGELTVTVDETPADGGGRSGGRIASVTVSGFHTPWSDDPRPIAFSIGT